MATYQSDVLIIGSGVIGNAAAYYLSRRGVDVAVLEASEVVGNGGSSRNGGGVRQSARDPREVPLAMYAVEHMWPTLSEELGTEVEYYKKGNLRLAKTQKHLEILQKLRDNCAAVGLEVSMLNGEEVRKINPYLSEEVIGASWCPTDGHANPMLTTLAFYKAARKNGARFYTQQKAVELRKVCGKLRQVLTEAGDVFEANTIVVAAGYESRKLAQTVGIDVPINPLREEALITEAEPHMFEQMLGTAEADFYGHQTTHGSFVFGGHTGLEDFLTEGMDIKTLAITAPCAARAILGYFPKLQDAKIVRTWAGVLDMSVDKVPIISRVEEADGMVLACGFTGHGFGIAPIVGLLLSELIADGAAKTLSLDAFRYDRFKAYNL